MISDSPEVAALVEDGEQPVSKANRICLSDVWHAFSYLVCNSKPIL